MITKDQILAALPNLNPEALQAIGAACRAFTGGASNYQPESTQAWLATAVGAVIGGNAPLNGAALKAFNKNAPLALGFMTEHFAKALENKTTALALMRYLLRLLANDLQNMKVPVTRVTLAQNLHRVGEVFENSFPGYAPHKVTMLVLAAILNEK